MSLSDALDMLKRKHRIGQAYRDIFLGPAGEAVLKDLLREAGLLEVSFEPGDPHATAFNEGKRAIGLHVLSRLRMDPGDVERLARREAVDRPVLPEGVD